MRRSLFCAAALAIVCMSSLLFGQQGPALDPELAAMERAIVQQGAGWRAGPTSVSQLSPEQRRQLCGDRTELSLTAPRTPPSEGFWRYTHHPEKHDWRDVDGQNWTTPVRNQGGCGSCAAFAAVGAMEAVADIFNQNPNLNLNLSEQHLFSCGCGQCCETGWQVDDACAYLTEHGAPNEGCFTYVGHDIDCRWTCKDWEARTTKISCRNWVGKSDIATPAEIKERLLENGPLAASMMVYTDFNYYTGGVYEHVSGTKEAGHGIVIVGWDDTTVPPCWICKNSWGPLWGEAGGGERGGWFRIRMGTNHCGIEEKVIFLVMGDIPDAIISETFHDFGSVGIGDTARWALPVVNQGAADLLIENITFQYGEFGMMQPDLPMRIRPGQTLPLTIVFAPTTTDVQAGMGTIETNDCRDPYFYLRLVGMGEVVIETVCVALDQSCARPGEQAVSAVNFDNSRLRAIPCSRVDLGLGYDESLVDVIGVTPTERTQGLDGFTWENEPGLISMTISDSQGKRIEAGTGPIARLIFLVHSETHFGQVSQITCLDPQVLNADGEPVQIDVQNGSASVYCRGDVNLDGNTNVLDIIRTVLIILGSDASPTDFEQWAADCNADGSIDVIDAVGLSQATLGLAHCQP